MAEHFNAVVLGTGNAGMAAAGVLRAAGKSVAMVESRDVGGTSPIRGCVPKKVLVAAAQVLHQIELAPQHHIKVGRPELDWAALIARERTFVDGVPDMFRSSLEGRDIRLYEAPGRFTGAAMLDVGGAAIEADSIVIATGSRPRDLPIEGWEHLITSDDILERTELPKSIVFIGGGVTAPAAWRMSIVSIWRPAVSSITAPASRSTAIRGASATRGFLLPATCS